ncbi:EPIDERMAL PATTERNING FACTOR-like protein 3 isoform X1 [Papaver somniferum]|nr:EPIDERMAL PATTERNING FACTOR-like protein 3 isoform X1 [Papaver somniferum]
MWTTEEQNRRRRRICFVAVSIVISLHLMGLVSATSRTFTTNHEAHHQQQAGQISEYISPAPLSSSQQEFLQGMGGSDGEYKMLSTLGSRPPSCEHKCGGCVPCEAIQVPTTTDRVGIQYANYEPEGWKCKCGTTFFNP